MSLTVENNLLPGCLCPFIVVTDNEPFIAGSILPVSISRIRYTKIPVKCSVGFYKDSDSENAVIKIVGFDNQPLSFFKVQTAGKFLARSSDNTRSHFNYI